MKSLFLALTILLTFSIFATERCDLKFEKTNQCLNLNWVYGPYLDQYNSVKIEYSENTTVSSVKVIPWMVMHGHEHGSRPVTLTKTGEREYLVDKIYFMGGMMGDWFLKIQLLDNANNVIDETRQLIKFN